jgi:hypothetical protein
MVFSRLGFRCAVLCIHISIASITFIGEYPYHLETVVRSAIGLVHWRCDPCLLLHLLHIACQLIYNT